MKMKLSKFVKIQLGARLMLAIVGVALFNWLAVAVALFMPIVQPWSMKLGVKPEFDLDGLTGETKELFETIQKRAKPIETLSKKEVVDEIRSFTEGLKLEKLKDIDFDALRAALSKDGIEGIRAALLAQGEALAKLQVAGGGNTEAPKTLRQQVAEWHKANEAVIKEIRSGQKRELPPLEIRVASPMTPANTLNGSAYLPKPEFQSGINDLVRVKPTFWDYVKKGRTGAAAYVWVNKTNPLGAAAFIGPGIAKPGISFELNTEISAAKKIAASEKIAIELLDDIDGMTTFLEQELRYKVDAKTNTTLMTGTLSATVPAGIQTISVPFSLTGLLTTNPNNMDAIRAIVAQLAVGNFDGSYGNVTVFINPVDAANMDMQKASTNGTYLLPPFATADGKTIAGAAVVEDNNVAVGYVQAALLDLFKVLIYKDYSIAYGWENDDFTKNLVTVIGERRLHSYHSANHNGAFIYDTFANIKTLIG